MAVSVLNFRTRDKSVTRHCAVSCCISDDWQFIEDADIDVKKIKKRAIALWWHKKTLSLQTYMIPSS